jgi:outer membrane protein assembly factor BamB
MVTNPPARGIGRYKVVAAAIVIAALVVLTAIAILPARLGSSSTSSGVDLKKTSTGIDTAIVESSFADHMQWLSSRNLSAIDSQYASNATVTWAGQVAGLTGNYSGAGNIRILMGSFLGKFISISIGNVTLGKVVVSDDLATVNSSFALVGEDPVLGNVSATISAEDSFAYSASSGAWLISQEVWDFLSYGAEYLVSSGGPGPAASATQAVDALSISADSNYLAAGTKDGSDMNGSVYLVSLSSQTQSWRHVTNNTAIDTVAVSGNGSYVAAGGYWSAYRDGEVYLFNTQGKMLWNVSTGRYPIFQVAISANGSRIAADYTAGVIYLNTAGDVLWNFTFPSRSGGNSILAMSRDGGSVVVSAEDMLLGNWTNFGWGVFCLNSQGHQVWNYTEDNAGTANVLMSANGSYVAGGPVYTGNSNGSVYLFDGATGALLWKHQEGMAAQPVAISPDGSYVAAIGDGAQLFTAGGQLLWNFTNLGIPAGFVDNGSALILSGGDASGTDLVGDNGTVLASYDVQGIAVTSGAGSVWAVASDSPMESGSCAAVHVFNAQEALPSEELCP